MTDKAIGNSKMARLLRHIPDGDLPEFRDFVASPVFNKDHNLLAFLDRLLQDYPRFPSHDEVIADLYPNEANVPDSRMDRLKNGLVVLIWEYIDFRARYRDADRHYHALGRIAEWFEREEYNIFAKEAGKLMEELDSGKAQSVELFHNRYLLHQFAAENTPVFSGDREWEIKAAFQNLARYAEIAKLRLLCAIVTRSRVRVEEELDQWVQQELEKLPASDPQNDPPLLEIYRHCLDLQLNPYSCPHYDRFLDALLSETSNLAVREGHDLYQYAVNFQIRLFNRDQKNISAASEIVFLYQKLLENGFLYERGGIAPWNYKNIATLMGRIGQLDWLESFLDECEEKINNDPKGNAANFVRGLLAYYRRDLSETVRRMEAILSDFEDVFWGLEARGLLLQTHFERGQHDDLETTYHQARMYAKRKAEDDINPVHARSYSNFFAKVFRLSAIITGDQDKRSANLDKLEKKVRDTWDLANKSWLLSKIAEAKA